MSNMSYCRFQNTVSDLRDCQEALDEMFGDLSEMSADEQRAARRLIRICREIAEDHAEAEHDD